MSPLQDFWLHATPGNLQGKLCGATRAIQWWNGKRLFNSLACGWKHSMAHPALPCVLPDSSSASGTSLTPPVLLLLAPTQLSTSHGLGHATSMSPASLGPSVSSPPLSITSCRREITYRSLAFCCLFSRGGWRWENGSNLIFDALSPFCLLYNLNLQERSSCRRNMMYQDCTKGNSFICKAGRLYLENPQCHYQRPVFSSLHRQ